MKIPFEELLHERRTWKTAALYFAFIGMGFCQAVTGPSMLDLKIKTQSTTEEITLSVIGRATGVGVGCIAHSFLPRKLDVQLVIAIALACAAAAQAIVPVNTNVWGVVASFFMCGLFCGILEICCNMYVIELWGKKCPSFLQILHFCFGFGSCLAPLIVRPYLLQIEDEDSDEIANIDFKPEDVRVQVAFNFIAAWIFLSAFFFAIIFTCFRETPIIGIEKENESNGKSMEDLMIVPESGKQKGYRFAANAMAMFFMFFYCGIEVALGSYLTPFAVNSDLHLAKKTGALLSSVYWMTFTFARLATIFYIVFVGARNSMIIALAIVFSSNIFLVGGGNTTAWCLWTGVILNGAGMSSMWGTLFALIQSYYPMTHRLTSLLVIAASCGECILSVTMGAFIDSNCNIIMMITMACSIALFILFALMYLFLHLFQNLEEKQSERIDAPIKITP